VGASAQLSAANTRFVLTTVAAGVATPEIASAAIASGLRPPAFTATAVSGAAPLRATAAAQAQVVGPQEAPRKSDPNLIDSRPSLALPPLPQE
jgi:hypothetical protein